MRRIPPAAQSFAQTEQRINFKHSKSIQFNWMPDYKNHRWNLLEKSISIEIWVFDAASAHIWWRRGIHRNQRTFVSSIKVCVRTTNVLDQIKKRIVLQNLAARKYLLAEERTEYFVGGRRLWAEWNFVVFRRKRVDESRRESKRGEKSQRGLKESRGAEESKLNSSRHHVNNMDFLNNSVAVVAIARIMHNVNWKHQQIPRQNKQTSHFILFGCIQPAI